MKIEPSGKFTLRLLASSKLFHNMMAILNQQISDLPHHFSALGTSTKKEVKKTPNSHRRKRIKGRCLLRGVELIPSVGKQHYWSNLGYED